MSRKSHQVVGGLVQKQYIRLRQQGPCNGHAPALTPRQMFHLCITCIMLRMFSPMQPYIIL